MTALQDIRAILARELAEGPGLRLAIVFGSAARGELREDSDIDLAILPSNPELPLRSELELGARLERALGREVDLVRIDRANPVLAWRIARDGVVILASPAFEAPRFLARAAAEHDEMAPLFDDARRRYAARVGGTKG